MKRKIFSVLLIVSMLLVIMCGLTGCGINSKQENNVEQIEETSWTTQVISKDDYYYYIYDSSDIRGIRKDQMDYKLVYKPEYSIHVNIDSQCYSIYNNDIYFLEYNYENDGDYKIFIKKIDIDGKNEAVTLSTKSVPYNRYSNKSHYNAYATSKGIYYTINKKMYMYDFDSQKEITYKTEFTDENKPEYFTVSEDNNIYYIKEKNLYMLSKDELKVLKENIGNIKQYKFVKRGNNLYGCNATLGMDADKLQYISLNDYSINTVDGDYKGNVFNIGNVIYLLTETKIYILENNKWVEHIDLKDYKYDGSLGGSTNGDIIFDDTVLTTLGAFGTKFYNYKDGFYYQYKKIDEGNATRDTYLLRELKSTKVLENAYNISDGDYKYLYKEDYNAIIKRNDTNTSEYEIFCSNDDILNFIGNEMKIYSIGNECLNDNYCYWSVTSENTTSKEHKIFILKKKLDGTENIQKVAEIGENADLVSVVYSKNYVHLVTSYSIYQINIANNSLTNLYTNKNKSDKLSMESVFFLSDEVIIYEWTPGHLLVSAYDGSYKGETIFDRSYSISKTAANSRANQSIENGTLSWYGTKINIKTGKIL